MKETSKLECNKKTTEAVTKPTSSCKPQIQSQREQKSEITINVVKEENAVQT